MPVCYRKRALVERVLQKTYWLSEEVPQKVSWQEKVTIMVTEVEPVLNSRLLTYLHQDVEDDPPLIPAHFLCGHMTYHSTHQRRC